MTILELHRHIGVMRLVPKSFGFFFATAIVFVLQLIPFTGVFLMFLLAMFWSVPLMNLGMIGTAIEAATGRVSRWWMVVPVAFYGGYYAFAAADHAALRRLRDTYDLANAKVAVPFDPQRQALLFDGEQDDGTWFVENYQVPVVFVRDPNHAGGTLSIRAMPPAICDKIYGSPALRAAGIDASAIDGDDASGSPAAGKRFCIVRMPERPALPLIRAVRREERLRYGSLPITRPTTSVIMPDRKRFDLLGGTADPLKWIPMPAIGCGLNSMRGSWNCDAGFLRHDRTPIVSGGGSYRRDETILAHALQVERVGKGQRSGGDATRLLVKMKQVENVTLARQFAALDRMIADPSFRVADLQAHVLASRPEEIAGRTVAIVTGLERAVGVIGEESGRAAENGLVLAQLTAALPPDRFAAYGPRLLALYRANLETGVDDGGGPLVHWLWRSEPLMRRVGDLGAKALFVATDPRASLPQVNGAGIEAMCRIGASGRSALAPVLRAMWRRLEPQARDERVALFVAMRRTGIAPPPLASGSSYKEHGDPIDELVQGWGAVTPASPPRICSLREQQARQEELWRGPRSPSPAP